MLSALATVTLLFTLPSMGQLVWTEWDPAAQDSVLHVECSGGQAIHQLATAKLYFNPVTGGGWRVVAQQGVPGMEGQPAEFTVDSGPGGHYYVTTTNPMGESCASPVVFVPGSIVTGIEPESPTRNPVRVETFDLQGRLVHRLSRSGVYFQRTTYDDGHMTTRKIVHLR